MDKKPAGEVRYDASWYSENASSDVIERLKKQRQDHVNQTVKRRAEGKVGVSISELIGRGAEVPNSRQRPAAPRQPLSISMPASSPAEPTLGNGTVAARTTGDGSAS